MNRSIRTLLASLALILFASFGHAQEPSSRVFSNYAELKKEILLRISAAQKHVLIATYYFDDNDIGIALSLARYRGLMVEVYVGSASVASSRASAGYNFLVSENVPAAHLINRSIPALSTVMLVDYQLIWVGSNLDILTVSHNLRLTTNAASLDDPRQTLMNILPPPLPPAAPRPPAPPPPRRVIHSRPVVRQSKSKTKNEVVGENEIARRLPSKTIWQMKQEEQVKNQTDKP